MHNPVAEGGEEEDSDEGDEEEDDADAPGLEAIYGDLEELEEEDGDFDGEGEEEEGDDDIDEEEGMSHVFTLEILYGKHPFPFIRIGGAQREAAESGRGRRQEQRRGGRGCLRERLKLLASKGKCQVSTRTHLEQECDMCKSSLLKNTSFPPCLRKSYFSRTSRAS